MTTHREELIEIIGAEGVWADRVPFVADALIPFIEQAKAEALREAGTYLAEFTDSPWGMTAAKALDDRADAIEKATP